MDKVVIEPTKMQDTTIMFQGKPISVRQYLMFAEETMLIDNFLHNYFEPSADIKSIDNMKYDPINAEMILQFSIIGMLTNIDITNLPTEALTVDKLFEKVTEQVINYSEFRGRLWTALDAKEREIEVSNSLGMKLDELFTAAKGVIDQLSKLSPDDVAKMKETGLSMLKEIENSPTSALFTETRKRGRKSKDEGKKTSS